MKRKSFERKDKPRKKKRVKREEKGSDNALDTTEQSSFSDEVEHLSWTNGVKSVTT